MYLASLATDKDKAEVFQRYMQLTINTGPLSVRLKNWITKNEGAAWARKQAHDYYDQAVEANKRVSK